MNLKQYLAETGQTVEAFGNRINRSGATVSRLCNEKQLPDWDTIEAIEVATGGIVTRNDFGPTVIKGDAA